MKTKRELIESCSKLRDALSLFNQTSAESVRKEIDNILEEYAKQARAEERATFKKLFLGINGIEAWITDREMKVLFQKTMRTALTVGNKIK